MIILSDGQNRTVMTKNLQNYRVEVWRWSVAICLKVARRFKVAEKSSNTDLLKYDLLTLIGDIEKLV